MPEIVECFGVVDLGTILYESLSDCPREALYAAEWPDEDGNRVHERLLTGAIKVHRIRIEILGEATMPPPKAKPSKAG